MKEFVKVELWVPKSNHKGYLAILTEDRYLNVVGRYDIPVKGDMITLRTPKKMIWRKVSKVVYDIKRDVFKVYIDFTHNVEQAVDYKWITFTATVTFTETYERPVIDYIKQWMDLINTPTLQPAA